MFTSDVQMFLQYNFDTCAGQICYFELEFHLKQRYRLHSSDIFWLNEYL